MNQSESARRRIVVPLGEPSKANKRRFPPVSHTASGSAPRRKSVIGTILKIFALLVIVVVIGLSVGGFLWWRHYQTTPAYSLALLVDAAQNNDMPAVDRIVDTDKIVGNFTDQVVEKAASRYGGALNPEVKKSIRARVPTLLPVIKQQLRDELAARIKEVSVKGEQRPFLLIAVAMPWVVDITASADKATATTRVHDQMVKFDLERNGESWKVIAIQDDALLQKLVDDVIKQLPAIAPGIESEIKKRLGKPPAALFP